MWKNKVQLIPVYAPFKKIFILFIYVLYFFGAVLGLHRGMWTSL